MKIAIASESKDIESMISNEAGRAPYFIIVEEGEVIEVIKNPFTRGGGGVGFAVAKMLYDMKTEKFIAGQIGPNVAQALEERGVIIEEASGRVSDMF